MRVLKNTFATLKLNNFFKNYFFPKHSAPIKNRNDRIYVICHYKSLFIKLDAAVAHIGHAFF
jgi:hypothetical protein